MKTLFIDNEIKYIGSQLAPHWIYKNFKIQGDAIVAFCGECEVKLSEMVDIEDVINDEPIYSKYMLSFITEQFNVELVEGVFRQRLLICCIKEALEKRVSGLKSDLGLEDIQEFAEEVMVNYSKEIEDIVLASTKVRGV